GGSGAGQHGPGRAPRATGAARAVVASTRPTARKVIGRRLAGKSRSEVKYAAEKSTGGRKIRKTMSGSSRTTGTRGWTPMTSPPSTRKIGYGMRTRRAAVASTSTAARSATTVSSWCSSSISSPYHPPADGRESSWAVAPCRKMPGDRARATSGPGGNGNRHTIDHADASGIRRRPRRHAGGPRGRLRDDLAQRGEEARRGGGRGGRAGGRPRQRSQAGGLRAPGGRPDGAGRQAPRRGLAVQCDRRRRAQRVRTARGPRLRHAPAPGTLEHGGRAGRGAPDAASL